MREFENEFFLLMKYAEQWWERVVLDQYGIVLSMQGSSRNGMER